ncbi:MAG: hypothetical protein NTV22_01755 [bacterium]|nr:hypothetical protein [bacterium]
MKTLATLIITIALITVALPLAASTWTGGGANWNSNVNPGWNGTGVPNAIDAVANIAAGTGNITVNGTYIVGTITAGGAYSGRTLLTSSGNLTFDVTTGNALFDLSNGNATTGTSMTVNTPLTLNDTLEIRNIVSSGSALVTFTGLISGNAGLLLANTGSGGSAARYDLQAASSTFAGGVTVGSNTLLRINASAALGTGKVTRVSSPVGGNNGIAFRVDTSHPTQVHSNDFDLSSNASGSAECFSLQNSTMNVTLNGVISGVLGNWNRANLNLGTLVLAGAGANTWTGQFRSDSGGTFIVNKVGGLGGGVMLRAAANTTISLLYGVADTDTSLITLQGNSSSAAENNIVKIGLADGNAGLVSLNNATALDLNWFTAAAITGLQFHSGNTAAGTLAVTTQIKDSGVGANARNVTVTGSGSVNLNRAAGNNYNGTTTVFGVGALLVNNTSGSATGRGTLMIKSGATLGGAGIVTGALTIVENGGTLAPGSSVGTLTVGALTMNANSTNNWEKGTGVNVADKTVVNGDLNISYPVTIRVLPLTGATPDGPAVTNTIYQVSGTLTGFENLVLDLSQKPDWTGQLVQMADGKSIGVLLIPEPAAFGLLALLVLGLRVKGFRG